MMETITRSAQEREQARKVLGNRLRWPILSARQGGGLAFLIHLPEAQIAGLLVALRQALSMGFHLQKAEQVADS